MEIGIGAVNARTLWCDGMDIGAIKLYQIIFEMRLYDIDVMGISETRWRGIGSFYVEYDTRTFYKVLYYGTLDYHRDGVAIILSPKAQLLYESYLAHIPAYPGRLLSVLLTNTDIFMMYAPQQAGTKRLFLERLIDALQRRERALILMGDLNEDGADGGNSPKFPYILNHYEEIHLLGRT